MAVVLYRQGTTHESNGIECEMQVVNEYSFTHLLEDGWFFSPEEAYEKVPDNKSISAEKEETPSAGKVEKPAKKTRKLRAKKVKDDNQS